MKISLCSPMSISYYGGAEKQICQIAHLLQEAGYNVSVYALPFSYKGRNVNVEEVLNVPYYESWKHKIVSDISYIYYQPIYWRLFSIKGKKIAGMHSIETFYPVPLYSRKYWIFQVSGYPDLSSFDAIRTLNPALLVKHNKIFCIPDWIDISRYYPICKKKDEFSLLYVGRHTKWKGWPLYQKICHELNKKGYDFNYYTTGEGDNLIKGLGMVTGDMALIYSKCHLLIHPSRADTFGLAIVESMASGTPVITTPLLMHRTLKLPLLYAWSEEDFINKILKIYNKWNNERDWYKKLSYIVRKCAKKYDVTRVFPYFEKMFLEFNHL